MKWKIKGDMKQVAIWFNALTMLAIYFWYQWQISDKDREISVVISIVCFILAAYCWYMTVDNFWGKAGGALGADQGKKWLNSLGKSLWIYSPWLLPLTFCCISVAKLTIAILVTGTLAFFWSILTAHVFDLGWKKEIADEELGI
ncbi:MAG TPA: hypothetical protein VMD74_05690 [Candidatus Methylomirabilis sp.]|nr:hypothetical protein [Candidatus Methylomirabilis sp.]